MDNKNHEKLNEQTFSITTLKSSNVVARITGLVTRRQFLIKSISVGDSMDENILRLTLVIKGDQREFDQLQKQVGKLLDVIDISPIDESHKIEREIALIKFQNFRNRQSGLLRLINSYNGNIINSNPDTMVVELIGTGKKIDDFIDSLSKNNITDIARTGVVAINHTAF